MQTCRALPLLLSVLCVMGVVVCWLFAFVDVLLLYLERSQYCLAEHHPRAANPQLIPIVL